MSKRIDGVLFPATGTPTTELNTEPQKQLCDVVEWRDIDDYPRGMFPNLWIKEAELHGKPCYAVTINSQLQTLYFDKPRTKQEAITTAQSLAAQISERLTNA